MGQGYLISAMLALLLLNVGMSPSHAEGKTYTVKESKIEVRLVPEKTEFQLGEPIHLTFVVRNLSHQCLLMDIGANPFADYNRTGFRFEARRNDGLKVLPPPLPNLIAGDYIREPNTLSAGKSETVDLFLPKMLKLSQPGRYTLLCHTELDFCQDVDKVMLAQPPMTTEITTEASAVLTILPADQRALGQVIDRLGRVAMAEPGKNTKPTRAMQQAAESLGAIEDARVIPWLVKMFQMRDYYQNEEVIDMLSKFNSSVAFEKLKTALTSRGLHVTTVYALAKCPYPKALPLLETLLHDPDDEVRQAIVWALAENNTAAATTMLQEMARDPSPKIRDQANYYLKQRSYQSKFDKPTWLLSPN